MYRASRLHLSYEVSILSAPLNRAIDVAAYLQEIWNKELINLQEQAYLLCLNDTNQVIGWICLNTGTANKTYFDIKLAAACAVTCVASGVIIAHNHPSGKLKPTADDINMTINISMAFKLLDIRLMDHIILGTDGFYSFKKNRQI